MYISSFFRLFIKKGIKPILLSGKDTKSLFPLPPSRGKGRWKGSKENIL